MSLFVESTFEFYFNHTLVASSFLRATFWPCFTEAAAGNGKPAARGIFVLEIRWRMDADRLISGTSTMLGTLRARLPEHLPYIYSKKTAVQKNGIGWYFSQEW